MSLSVVAVLTLALGVGANIVIFSVINAVMLQPLPFPAADQLVRIYSTTGDGRTGRASDVVGPSAMDGRDFAQSNHTFQRMARTDVAKPRHRRSAQTSDPLFPGGRRRPAGLREHAYLRRSMASSASRLSRSREIVATASVCPPRL